MQDSESTSFVPVASVAELDDVFERSLHGVVVLYNHDPWCPISGRALQEVERLGGEVAIVDVSRQRDVTREIQARSGVRHESPQVIVLHAGKPFWHASHFSITSERVREARDAAASAQG